MDSLSAKLAADILLLDLTGITLIADYFVIATGESERQLRTMSRSLEQEIKEKHHIAPLSIEGTASAGWILLDYGSVVVHLFSERQRKRYNLEEFWSNARTVVRIA
ncbi:MAG: ribosome silencing factor [Chloroflexi bacterium]|nr:ribosome silencing factor [Chloroflexota bacterium]